MNELVGVWMQSNYLITKHLLLFKAAFAEPLDAEAAMQQWQQQFQRADLDWTTRSILPLLVQRFPKHTADIARYRRYYQQTWLDNLIKFNKLNKILKEFSEADIPICLLKGSAMLLYYYKNMGMRPGASDIDLLIPHQCLPVAMSILEQHGMKATSIYKHSGPQFAQLIRNQDESVIRFHHAINFNARAMDIDLHWKMSPYIKKSDFACLQKRMQPIQLNQQTVYVLSMSDHFIHTCFHGMSQIASYQKLWWLIDLLYLLSNKSAAIDWQEVYVLSRQYKVDVYLMNALQVVQTINPQLVPHELLAKYHKSIKTKWSLWQFKLHHSPVKLVKQLCCYYYLFRANQPGIMHRINPILFIRFIKIYFGFSSIKDIFHHFRKQSDG